MAMNKMTDKGHTERSPRVISDETREKMRASQLGKTASQETRNKMRLAKLGTKQTPQHRANISKAKKEQHARQRRINAGPDFTEGQGTE